MRWERSIIAWALVGCAVACRERPALHAEPKPWEKGEQFSDPELQEILKPDRPLDSANLYVGTDKRLYYVAQFQEKPNRFYLTHYRKLVESRGFLIHPRKTSPHVIPPHVLGYEFIALRKGRPKPYALRYRRFVDRDPKWAPYRETKEDFPEPLKLDASLLILRFGFAAQDSWQESVLIPTEDVVKVKELPFPRLPGAILFSVSKADDRSLVDPANRGFARWYIVQGSTMHSVLAHYERTLRARGIPVERSPSETQSLRWWSEEGVRGFTAISVEEANAAIQPVPGVPLTLEELRRVAPLLLQDFPGDALAYRVRVEFTDPQAAVLYWPADLQARRQLLLKASEGKKD